MEWRFQEMKYFTNLKEYQIYNELYKYPFYAETTRGDYFALRPSIRIHNKELIEQINQIISLNLLTNGIFDFNDRLNNYVGLPQINNEYEEDLVRNFWGQYYYIKIYKQEQIEKVTNWFKTYINDICLPLFGKNKSQIELYTFLKEIFLKQVKIEKNLTQREIAFSKHLALGHYALITMVYLGYQTNANDIMQISSMAKEYKKGPLYEEPILELINHFEKKNSR